MWHGDVTAAWTDEIRRRIDEVEAGTAELDDLDTVHARLEAASRTRPFTALQLTRASR